MKGILIFSIATLLFSCEWASDEPLQASYEELLSQQQEIIKLSESVSCTNSSDWKITPMGSKACGGPSRYIAYHVSVEKDFLDLVNRYTALEKAYNEKNNVISDCMMVVAPKSVTCEGNKPVLVF
ncbi:MAG: hypothetical protein ACKO44_01935 [Algoriphagus sp.]